MSFRTRERIPRRAQTALSIQFPSHFLSGNDGEYYRCLICTHHPEFTSLSDALKHEDATEHVKAQRELDQPPRPLTPFKISGDLDGGSEEVEHVPLVASSQSTAMEAVHEHVLNSVMHVTAPSDTGTSTGTGRGHFHPQNTNLPSTHPSQDPLSGNSNWYTNFNNWSESAEGYFAIPGPTQPSDPPDAVYDLCGGFADPGDDLLSDDEDFESEIAEFAYKFSLDAHTETAQPPSPSPPPDVLPLGLESQADPSLGMNCFAPEVVLSYIKELKSFPNSRRIFEPAPTKSEDWWPFANKHEALLSIMTVFPRAVFSGKELDVVRWFAEKCQIAGMPNSSSLQSRFEHILKLLGLESRLIQSKLASYALKTSVEWESSIMAEDQARFATEANQFSPEAIEMFSTA